MNFDETNAFDTIVRYYLVCQSGIQRHHALHNLAQLATIIAPENWSEQIYNWNESYLLPPLGEEEVDRIISAVRRRTIL